MERKCPFHKVTSPESFMAFPLLTGKIPTSLQPRPFIKGLTSLSQPWASAPRPRAAGLPCSPHPAPPASVSQSASSPSPSLRQALQGRTPPRVIVRQSMLQSLPAAIYSDFVSFPSCTVSNLGTEMCPTLLSAHDSFLNEFLRGPWGSVLSLTVWHLCFLLPTRSGQRMAVFIMHWLPG